MVALLSLVLAGEAEPLERPASLERVPAFTTLTLNGVDTVVEAEGWIVIDETGRFIGPAEFALLVGDHETTALLATVQARRDRRGRTLMVLGGLAAAGGTASFAAGSVTTTVPLARAGLAGGLGGFVLLALGRQMTRTLHPQVNELEEIYTAEEVDRWLQAYAGSR